MCSKILGGIVLGCFALSTVVWAENRALIIGIGEAYQQHGIRGIPGPARDIDLVLAMAIQMGFQKSQIKVLREEQATKAAMIAGLQWLRDGVQAREHALLYYSGHGTQVPDNNGDENDGCDEALVPVDTKPNGVLRDDDIGMYLQNLQQRATVMVVIDSCFSGTITRDLNVPQELIKYSSQDSQQCGNAINRSTTIQADKPVPFRAGDQLIVLTATASNEVALGDITGRGQGSLFTQALYDAMTGSTRPLSFQEVRDYAAAHIRKMTSQVNYRPQTPQLEGNASLFRNPLRLASVSEASVRPPVNPGVTNAGEFLNQLVRNSKFPITMQSNVTRIPLGQRMSFTVRSSQDGYLNLVVVEPKGDINVIFPNKIISDNRLAAHETRRIPEDIGGFRFEASAPIGISRVVAIVTRQPLNMYTRDVGKVVGDFKVVSMDDQQSMEREINRAIVVVPQQAPEASQGAFGATELVLEVVK